MASSWQQNCLHGALPTVLLNLLAMGCAPTPPAPTEVPSDHPEIVLESAPCKNQWRFTCDGARLMLADDCTGQRLESPEYMDRPDQLYPEISTRYRCGEDGELWTRTVWR